MGDTIIGGVIAIGGVLIGVVLNVFRDRAAWRRETALAAGASAAEIFHLIWVGDDEDDATYRQFDSHLRKLKVQLELLGVSSKTIAEVDTAARHCRQQSQASYESGEEDDEGRIFSGIPTTVIDQLEKAIQSTNRELRSRWRLPRRY